MEAAEFEKLLDEAFPTWDGKTSPKPGLRKVEMTGTGFLRWLDEAKAREIIKRMKERLPADTAFFWQNGKRLMEWEGTGLGSDLFFVIFASGEWEPIEEGETIPAFSLDRWLD